MSNNAMHEVMLRQTVTPRLENNTTVASGWFTVQNARRLFALINMGVTDTTVDAKIQQATDSSGTGAKDVTGAAITQFSATDDGKAASIDMETDRLDHKNGFYYVRLLFTIGDGTTGANVAAEILLTARHQPVTQPTTYTQQIVLAG